MGRLYVVATPIGNLDDITFRAVETLKNVNLVAAEDTRRTYRLLSHFGINTPVISYHKFNETERGTNIIEKIKADNIDVALVSDAGTPCISDPGCILVDLAIESGIDVIAVPGASAVISALSVCGFNFTKFCFNGFIPRESKEKSKFYEYIKASETDTFVMYESPNRIIASLQDMEKAFPEGEVFVINDITKLHEKARRGKISLIAEEMEKDEKAALGEYTIVLKKGQVSYSADEEEYKISNEARIIDEMINSDITMKEAVEKVSKKFGLSKKEVYSSSLNIKKLFS